jgi:hypothetical protein
LPSLTRVSRIFARPQRRSYRSIPSSLARTTSMLFAWRWPRTGLRRNAKSRLPSGWGCRMRWPKLF